MIPSSAHSSVVRGHVEFLGFLKVGRERRPAGPEFLLVIKRYFFKDEATVQMTSQGLDSSQVVGS